mmetsp:Transcript_7094/g.17736  ORF Transcript_7094/g.17736 Transcript_7094/m.17736 type:complete len:95 (+) Transcript_7094:66-350(+)
MRSSQETGRFLHRAIAIDNCIRSILMLATQLTNELTSRIMQSILGEWLHVMQPASEQQTCLAPPISTAAALHSYEPVTRDQEDLAVRSPHSRFS